MTLVWVCLDRAVLDVISSIPNDDIDARATVSLFIVVSSTFSSEAISTSGPGMAICTVFARRCHSACVVNLGIKTYQKPARCGSSRPYQGHVHHPLPVSPHSPFLD
jgi:hypothetical protein